MIHARPLHTQNAEVSLDPSFFQRGTITYRLHGGRHELLKLTHKALVSMDCQVHTQLIPVIPHPSVKQKSWRKVTR